MATSTNMRFGTHRLALTLFCFQIFITKTNEKVSKLESSNLARYQILQNLCLQKTIYFITRNSDWKCPKKTKNVRNTRFRKTDFSQFSCKRLRSHKPLWELTHWTVIWSSVYCNQKCVISRNDLLEGLLNKTVLEKRQVRLQILTSNLM